jgi:hypothetical protein
MVEFRIKTKIMTIKKVNVKDYTFFIFKATLPVVSLQLAF